MPLRQALELAASHAAQTEQRIAELHHKRGALEHEGMHDRAAVVDEEIARLRRSLDQIDLYVRTVQQRLPVLRARYRRAQPVGVVVGGYASADAPQLFTERNLLYRQPPSLDVVCCTIEEIKL